MARSSRSTGRSTGLTRSWGHLALAIYLFLVGLQLLLGLHFSGMHVILGLAAIVAGVLIALGR